MDSVYEAAVQVLNAGTARGKCEAARNLSESWARKRLSLEPLSSPIPDRPARPLAPELVPPYDVKRRGLGTPAGRAALLHAIAHIEFNAIDLAADMLARFGQNPKIKLQDRAKFANDWISVCADEARHFGLVQDRLKQMDTKYGDLPAHDGLWQAALSTKDDFIARLVIAPMVLEARGLDVTPAMIEKLDSVKDHQSADILRIIYDEEIGHVAKGSYWFRQCTPDSESIQIETFHQKVRIYFNGLLKPPFNRPARDLAGVPLQYYQPLSAI